MDCLGSFLVRRCCIPSLPYQFRSRIKPGLHWSLVERVLMAQEVPFASVVLSRASFCARCNVLPKTVRKIVNAAHPDHETLLPHRPRRHGRLRHTLRVRSPRRVIKYRSQCLQPHLVWRLQSWRACSRGTLQRPVGEELTGHSKV